MQLPPQITRLRHAGHDALQLTTRHGSAIVALHGAHLLSWVPVGQREVFWLSPDALPEPAAIRGGVPVCWPWFAKQGMPEGAMQHGPVRGLPWQISAIHASSDDEISLSFQPCAQAAHDAGLEALAPGLNALTPGLGALVPSLQVNLRLTLGQSLRQTLNTRNSGAAPFALTQALHSYFAVSHAAQVSIDGLVGLPYQDRLRDLASDVQRTAFALDQACDRTYSHLPQNQPSQDDASQAQLPQNHLPEGAGQPAHRYALTDPAWQRRIEIDTQGSQSVVVWNPGLATARKMADVPDDGWQDFFCIEAANAGPDVVLLAPGATHSLEQTLHVMPV
jgi:glucose-6-phosphate 1-epimerase